MTYSFNELIRAAAQAPAPEAPVQHRLALLGDSATQFFHRALLAWGKLQGISYDIWEADFDQIELQILAPDTEFHRFSPDTALVHFSSHKLRQKYYAMDRAAQASFSHTFLKKVRDLLLGISRNERTKVLFSTLEELDDAVFGHFAARSPHSFLHHVRRINLGLMDLAAERDSLFLLDVAVLSARAGREASFSPGIYVNTDLVHSLDFTAELARAANGIIEALAGRFKKCLILDLDNTLWGGVIGDDGMEGIQLGGSGTGKAFVEFQRWIKALQERGIILAVCSKNTESIARQPFEAHPDMVLRSEDIAVFVANWDNKADNIRYIQEVLNIGFDAMVFLDDNPAERQIVRENVPAITVPELPEDPALYLSFLEKENLFETVSYSENDAKRTRQYQQEALRKQQGSQFTNVDDFLASLDMVSYVREFRELDIPRVAQLSQRSNQFNLRTVRYTEGDIRRMVQDPAYKGISFNLDDKFGAHGLICAVILKEMEEGSAYFIDTWIMSCRVLKRGMERFVLEQLAAHARAAGMQKLVGEYLPTAKNGIVRDHYRDLGFVESAGKWNLELASHKGGGHFITPSTESK